MVADIPPDAIENSTNTPTNNSTLPSVAPPSTVYPLPQGAMLATCASFGLSRLNLYYSPRVFVEGGAGGGPGFGVAPPSTGYHLLQGAMLATCYSFGLSRLILALFPSRLWLWILSGRLAGFPKALPFIGTDFRVSASYISTQGILIALFFI